MATLDDKLLGEKLHCYCSSSEDEDGDKEEPSTSQENTIQLNPNEHNTGPKGVLGDWRRYKQLEVEKREENEKERLDLAKKLSLNCRSEREDREINAELESLENDLDEEDDEFLKAYMKARMQEMIESSVINRKNFGHVYELKDGDEFLDTVDNQDNSNVLIVIHIWDKASGACKSINEGLQTISKEYNYIKFCRIQATAAGLSHRFKTIGVPAILVYKGGELIKSFVRLTDALGDDFFTSDLESFLIENGVMSDSKLTPSIIKGPAKHNQQNDSDSE